MRSAPRTLLTIFAALTAAATVAHAYPLRPVRDDLMDAARAAYDHGRYREAVERARLVIAREPEHQVAWRLVGAASCQLKDASTARVALDHLGAPMDRHFVQSICRRGSLLIDGEESELMRQARQDYAQRFYQLAHDEALAAVPEAGAWLIVAAASCAVNDLKNATDAWRHLAPAERAHALDDCRAIGLWLR